MTTEGGREAELDPHQRVAEQAFRATERTEGMRRAVEEGQLSAANSFERSADHQDQAARTYEEAAGHNASPDESRQHAARHRQFAQEDRQIAQNLRRMAERDSTGGPA